MSRQGRVEKCAAHFRGSEILFWTFKFRCMLDVHVAMMTQVWRFREWPAWMVCKAMGQDATQAGLYREKGGGRVEPLECSTTYAGEALVNKR